MGKSNSPPACRYKTSYHIALFFITECLENIATKCSVKHATAVNILITSSFRRVLEICVKIKDKGVTDFFLNYGYLSESVILMKPPITMRFAKYVHVIIHTVKPVFYDHLIGYFSAFWSLSRWPRATKMSSRRQILLARVNWHLRYSLKHTTE